MTAGEVQELQNLNCNFRKSSSTRNNQEFGETFVLGDLFCLFCSDQHHRKHAVWYFVSLSLLQQQLRCLPPQLPFSFTTRQTAHSVLTQAHGGGWRGAKRQKAAWSLMTSKGLFAAQVQPPPNFCPLLIPSPLIGLIEDKLFEMDAQ